MRLSIIAGLSPPSIASLLRDLLPRAGAAGEQPDRVPEEEVLLFQDGRTRFARGTYGS